MSTFIIFTLKVYKCFFTNKYIYKNKDSKYIFINNFNNGIKKWDY